MRSSCLPVLGQMLNTVTGRVTSTWCYSPILGLAQRESIAASAYASSLAGWQAGCTQAGCRQAVGIKQQSACCFASNTHSQTSSPTLNPRPLKRIVLRDVPTSSSRSVLERYLSPGKILEFRHEDSHILGIVQHVVNCRTNAVAVQSIDGQTYKVLPSQVVVVLPGSNHSAEYLKVVQTKADAADNSQVYKLWKKLHAEAEAKRGSAPLGADPMQHYNILQLSRMIWDAADPASLYATHRLLTLDDVYFFRLKTRPPTYHVRGEEEVMRMRFRKKLETELASRRKKMAAMLKAALVTPLSKQEWMDGKSADAIMHIEAFARGQGEAPHGDALYALVDSGFDVSKEGAGLLLQAIGFWPKHVPLAVLREDFSSTFPLYVQAMADALVASPPPDAAEGVRKDYTDQDALAVDDEVTTEVDDAVFAETLPCGGWRVYIHVADPTALVSPGTPLDLEAMQRGRTLYLPWTKVPMFPYILAETMFSLDNPKACKTVTFVATLKADGSLEHGDVTLGMTRCRRITYDSADELLAAKSPLVTRDDTFTLLKALREISSARRDHRAARGAHDIPSLECQIRVENLDTVGGGSLQPEPEVAVRPIIVHESPSRQAVMELMVLAGEVGAKWAAARGVPVLFRGQEPPVPPTKAQLDRVARSALATGYLWRTRMMRGTASALSMQRHSGLGVDAYAQVTSPIRRYTDLLCHYQIKASLLGRDLPFAASSLDAAAQRVEEMTRRHKAVELDTLNHFLALYVERRPHEVYRAEVLGVQRDGEILVAVPALGIERTMALHGAVHPGQLRIVKAVVQRPSNVISWVEAR